ncbi:hypothetical protein [Caproiciproducens sp.]
MNINPLVLSALSGITSGGKAVSVTPIVYTGAETTYITFYTLLDKDDTYADDEPVQGSVTATIDIFSKGNYKPLLADVKARLKAAGFTIQGSGPEIYEKDTGFYHVPVDVYLEDCNG